MITAEVVADSVSRLSGVRITTMALAYPKYIHGELMTHRVFSRNARSSRAVPVEKVLREVATEPVMPIVWGANKRGMQAGDELQGFEREQVETLWRALAREVAERAVRLAEHGLHKQWANRPLEPFTHIFTLVTSTYWRNFYTLRRHADAQPEMRALADAMHAAHLASVPEGLAPGEWHLPYVNRHDEHDAVAFGDRYTPEWWATLCKLSAARCARVSYRTFDNRRPTPEEDFALFDRLMGAQPLHASPAEHQATPDMSQPQLWGNFHTWAQFRKTLLGENSVADCGIAGVL